MPPAQTPGQDARLRHGSRTRSSLEIELLDSLSRTRALTLDESLALEDAIRRQRELEAKYRRARKAARR